MAPFWVRRLFKSNSNNGLSLGHSNLVSNEVYICSGPLFMISWWSLHLAKGPMPDFNNGPGNDLNSSHSLAPRRLFETEVNNDPPQAIPNPVSDGEYICSGVLLMVFWWVPYLSKGCMSDVNNGPGGDSNSGPILAPGVYSSPTRIVALFWPMAFIWIWLE